jgi:hypothetical protein
MSRTVTRRLAVLGGTLGVVAVLGVGLALAAAPGSVTTATTGTSGDSAIAAVSSPAPQQPEVTTPATAPATAPAAAPAATSAPPAGAPAPTTAPAAAKAKPTPTTAAPAAPAAAPASPATPAAPAAPKLAPGQRLNPTSADVQAAITQLHTRIPLFAPTESQLRTFADAVCTSFDQGQTAAQVQSTVQQAVSHIQGASLSAADAQFAVTLMAQLRCPGYVS